MAAIITVTIAAAAIASTQRDKDHSLPVLMVRTAILSSDTTLVISVLPLWQAKVEELNRKIEKENQLKNLTSLNLSAALESTTKSMASDKVCI